MRFVSNLTTRHMSLRIWHQDVLVLRCEIEKFVRQTNAPSKIAQVYLRYIVLKNGFVYVIVPDVVVSMRQSHH
ncbi:MAG: hypothetical protein GFH27_549301n134 [Chloroflexi bacterium AL-W]|nr:hypothetical protein [Chloroflexi bacterium AL-N1]NOK68327.1 hypothetical protein [Chloroflexi bacterium AL-N10]NOK73973.1 hypothetical protein [Chloroflexi bacterium AL-N5]NOK82941.1 hypothetical protein [Chloroflexi bacterium AL-W]NOK90463.1 hypothetical protein [Chloroflexi bacterium AL-N15]